MRKLISGILAALVTSASVAAQTVPVSQLPAASALSGTEQIPVVQQGATKRATAAAIGATITTAPNTWTGKQTFPASGANGASINLQPGTPPPSPVGGDLWATPAGLFAQINGATNGPFATRDSVNVFDYLTLAQRADVRACTLTLDVTAGLIAAVTAASGTTSGRVIAPDGCYHTTATVPLPSRVVFDGASTRATRIVPNGNFPAFSALATYASQLSGVGVRDLSIICAGMSNTSSAGVKAVYVNGGKFERLYFNGCYRPLDLSDQWQTIVRGNHGEGAGSAQNYDGLYMGAPTDAANPNPNNAVIASDNEFQNGAGIAYHLLYFAGSKFVNNEGSDGVTAWKLCGVSYIVTIACHFGHFVNNLADTTSGAGVDIQQGANSLPVTDLMFSNQWIGNSHGYALYMSGVVHSQFDAHITAADNGVYAQNGNNLTFSADIADYNRNNNGSYAVTFDGLTASTVRATNTQSANPLGYNGIREINSSSGNSIWGGVAGCSLGLTFGGGSTGMTINANSCSYEVLGRQVRMTYYLGLSAKGTSTGNALLTGLPFQVNGGSFNYGSTSVSLGANMSSLSGTIINEGAPGSTTVNLYSQGASGVSSLTHSNFTSTSILYGALAYVKN